ncbi:MAG: RNA polymerase sigma factor [Ruminococcus sp.]|nr:RNA polymerase sigma factor [Ruminococcus sp.]
MTDREIVGLFLKRDESAIRAVSDKYMRYCASIAANILGSYDEAEDCVNEALMNAWESIPPHEPETLSTYLGRLTRNAAINRRRSTLAGKRGRGEAELVFEELSELVGGGESADALHDANALAREINEFLYTLPELKRNIFVCRYWYCDGISEIAAEFSVSKNKVCIILSRVRKSLREYLRKRGYEL